MYMYMHAILHACIYKYMYIYMHAILHACIWIYIHACNAACICMYKHVCIWIRRCLMPLINFNLAASSGGQIKVNIA